LYEKAGFQFIGPSDVVHGSGPWFEMRRLLVSQTIAPSADLLAVLSRTSERLAKSSFDQLPFERLVTEDGTNAFDLVCPMPQCSSIVLKSGIGRYSSKVASEVAV